MNVATFTAIINQLLPEPHAGLLNGIIFGTKASLSKDLYDALVATGTLHIVALSGMNISILVKVMHGTLLRVASRRITNMLTILLITGFVWFVGPSPSVIRAAIMGSLVLLSAILGRQNWSILTFMLTCGVMLFIKPAWIGDLSFQLSAVATLGIILFGGRSAEVASPNSRAVRSLASARAPTADISNLPKLPALTFLWYFIADDLRVTLSAQVFTIPLILFTFGRMSLVSPLTNVLIGWTIPILTPLGMFAAFVGWIFLPLGQMLAWPAWILLQYLIIVIEVTAKIPFASVGR